VGDGSLEINIMARYHTDLRRPVLWDSQNVFAGPFIGKYRVLVFRRPFGKLAAVTEFFCYSTVDISPFDQSRV
jgi:hypothetical protein